VPEMPERAVVSAPGERRRWIAGWVLLALAAGILLPLAHLRPAQKRLWGDEGTYVAMAASLAREGDFAFGLEDREWAEARLPEGATVIVQRTERGLAYSKPILYALLAAVPYRLLGEWGFLVLNLAALGAAALLAAVALRRNGTAGAVWLTLVTYLAAAAVMPYVLWRMSDALQLALALGGLALACGGLREKAGTSGGLEKAGTSGGLWNGGWLDGVGAAAAGGLALGLLTAMKLPNVALAVVAFLAQIAYGRGRRAVALAAAALVATLSVLALTERMTGAREPYKAVRTSFDGATGYPVGPGGEEAARRFETAVATNRLTLIPAAEPARIGWAAVTFLVGRHTGVLVYFPLAALLLWLALRAPDRLTWLLLAGGGAIAVFYTVWLPWNYFGGSTFLANRYFLVPYAALLLAPRRLLGPRSLAIAWLIALAAGSSALVSVAGTADEDTMSQSHVHAGLFRRLPYESTALVIDGQRDRYWAGDFVRFVDPYARVTAAGFRLDTGSPPAELLIASARVSAELVFEVEADHPQAEIVLESGGSRQVHALERSGRGSRGTVTWTPPPARRRHRFWWDDRTTYQVWTLRLAVRVPGGETATARLRYLGRTAVD